MKPADDREEVLLREALQRAKGSEREAFLNQACAGNQALRGRLEALLQAQESPAPLPEPPPANSLPDPGAPPPQQSTARSAPVTEKPGDKIGHYKLLQHIGEGGFGVVYMAEQEEPIRRRVAFKVIKLGMDTREVVARFEAERQALALMDHPNIAKVLDAGATETGRPYFVMELVRGIKITDYCDQNNLSTEERLNLFVQICQAIQHAHQKGIIHRDIKPSNILVTLHDGKPVPKVIDFGIAKATGGQVLTDKTLFTAYEQFMGTPAYMSPEQAEMSGLDIDTRTDIYSLGVLLYELLTGRTPFDQKELVAAGLDGMRRIIREREPARPSTRLTDELVGADVRRLHSKSEEEIRASSRRLLRIKETIPMLRGDLDWIVMKCLEKDRTHRYETASGLAQDILNHLSNEPVVARPPSRAYRLQKLVRRNKLAFAAAGAVTAALLIGLGLSTWLFFKEKDARRRAVAAEKNQSELRQQAEAHAKKARDEARRSEQTALFLEEMLGGVSPSVARGRDTQMLREILDRAAERVGKDFKDSLEVEAELRTTIGDVYMDIQELPKAEEMYRAVLNLNRRLWGDLSTNVADSLENVSRAAFHQAKPKTAEPWVVEELMIRTNLLGNEHPKVADSLRHLAHVRLHSDRWVEAEALYRQSLAVQRKLLGNDSEHLGSALKMLYFILFRQGRTQEAEATLREGLAIDKKLLGAEEPAFQDDAFLGEALVDVGKLDEAESILRPALAATRKVLGPNDWQGAVATVDLGRTLEKKGALDEAEQLGREALAVFRKKQAANPRPIVIAMSLDLLGHVLIKKGHLAEAETMFREEISAWQKGEVEHVDEVGARYQVLAVLREQGKLDQAEALHRETVAAQTKFLASRSEPDRYFDILNLLGFDDRLKPAAAESLYREGLRLNRQLYSTNRFHELPWLAGGLGDTLRKEGKLAEAEPLLREAVTNAAKLWPNDFAKWRWHVYNLLDVLYSQRKQADAYRVISDVLTPGLLGPSRETALLEVRANLSGRGRQWKEATADYTKLIEIAPTDHWLSHQLAPVLVMAGDRQGYGQLCRRILARSGATNDPAVSQQMALDCLLLSPSGADLPTVDRLADFAVRAYRDNWYLHWFQLTQGLPDFHWYQLTKGLAEYRQGHFAGAVEWARRALVVAGEFQERDAQAYALLAMAQHQLSHADEARAALGKAIEITQTKLPQLDSGDLGSAWADLARAHILLREAKALLEGEAAATHQLKP